MNIPPVIDLLHREFSSRDIGLAHVNKLAKDKGFLRDVRAQAEYSVGNKDEEPYINTSPGNSFVIHAADALSPFSRQGVCRNPACRLQHSKNFARSVGLYCDSAIVAEEISAMFLRADKFDDKDANDLYANVLTLNEIWPLIRDGILQFSKPVSFLCKHCLGTVREPSEAIWAAMLNEAVITVIPQKRYVVFQSEMFDVAGEHMVVGYELTQSEIDLFPLKSKKPIKIKSLKKDQLRVIKDRVLGRLGYNLVRNINAAKIAARFSGVIATTARLDVLGFRLIEYGRFSRNLENWEKLRSIKLPWIEDLTTEQIIQLRQNASKALPRFRSRLRTDLFSSDNDAETSNLSANKVIAALRDEALEVESELLSIKTKSSIGTHAGLGLISLGCVVYGIGTNNPLAMAAAGPLTSILLQAHSNEKAAQAEAEKIIAKPAYVLWAASQFSSHASAK